MYLYRKRFFLFFFCCPSLFRGSKKHDDVRKEKGLKNSFETSYYGQDNAFASYLLLLRAVSGCIGIHRYVYNIIYRIPVSLLWWIMVSLGHTAMFIVRVIIRGSTL